MRKLIVLANLALLGVVLDICGAAKADVIIDVTETANINVYFGSNAGFGGGQLFVRHRDFGGMNPYSAMKIDLGAVDAHLAANPGTYVSGVTLSVALENTDPSPGPGKDYWFQYNPGDWADNWDPRTISDTGSFPMGPAPVNFPEPTATFHVNGSDPIGQVYSLTNDLLRDMVANDPNRVLSLWFASHENSEGAAGWFNRYFNDVQLLVRFEGGASAVPEPASVVQATIGLAFLAGAARRLQRSRTA